MRGKSTFAQQPCQIREHMQGTREQDLSIFDRVEHVQNSIGKFQLSNQPAEYETKRHGHSL